MSESATTTTDMEMETMLTRAVQKLFKWQLSGLTGTLIVASMLWLAVFFVFFLILVFVMCVEYHYQKKAERQDAEQALPTDNGKMWAEKRSSRENSNTSMRKIAPVPMPPLPITNEPKAVVISDMADEEEEAPPAEPEVTQELPTEAVTEESVIVDAPQDEPIESPPPAEEEAPPPAEEEAPPPDEEAVNPENTQEEEEAEPEADAVEESQPEPEEPAEEAAPPENDDSQDTNVVESAEEEAKPPDSPTAPDKNGED